MTTIVVFHYRNEYINSTFYHNFEKETFKNVNCNLHLFPFENNEIENKNEFE